MTAPETPAAVERKNIPFVTDALRLVRVLFSPGAVFEEQRDKPAFWIPWVIVTVAMLVVAHLSFPFTLAMTRLASAARGRPLPEAAEAMMRTMSFVSVPVVMLVMLLLSAGVMYVTLMASGSEARFKGLMSVAVFTSPIAVLQLLLTYVVLTLRGPDGLQTVADYQVSFGLDLLLPRDAQTSGAVVGLLRGVSPFSVWGMALTAIGVRITERTSKGAAWSAAAVAFILGVILSGVGGMMGGGAQ